LLLCPTLLTPSGALSASRAAASPSAHPLSLHDALPILVSSLFLFSTDSSFSGTKKDTKKSLPSFLCLSICSNHKQLLKFSSGYSRNKSDLGKYRFHFPIK